MLKKGFREMILVGLLLGGFYVFENWKHRFDRPWAYDSGPVLLGKWEGQFRDPDGVLKSITLEIIEPEVENKHQGYGTSYDQTREFKGSAQVISKQGIEEQRVTGVLGSKDGHRIDQISFSPVDENKQVLESFNVSYTDKGGTWDGGDVIKTTVIFTYRTKTGSAFSDSGDPRFDVKAPLTLHRIKD